MAQAACAHICDSLAVYSFALRPNPSLVTHITAWAGAQVIIKDVARLFEERAEFVSAVICGSGNYTNENFFIKEPYNADEIKRMLTVSSFDKKTKLLGPDTPDPEGLVYSKRLRDLLDFVAPRATTLTAHTIEKIVAFVLSINPMPPGNHKLNDNYPVIYVTIGYKLSQKLAELIPCPFFGWEYDMSTHLPLNEIYQKSLSKLMFRNNPFHVVTSSESMQSKWDELLRSDRVVYYKQDPFKSADAQVVESAGSKIIEAATHNVQLLKESKTSRRSVVASLAKIINDL